MQQKYVITPEVIEKLKNTITNSDNKLTQLAGINVVELSERNVRLEMPLGDVHINHVGTAYAISMLMLVEITGATLIRSTYGFTYTPIIKKIEISYLKPTKETLVCELSISKEDADRMITPIEERGRGNFLLPIILKDINNETIAEANVLFYLLSVL